MGSWIRQNPFVVAALALPLLVIGFFLAATAIPALLVDDPQHDLLFAVQHHDSSGGEFTLRYKVVDGQLSGEAQLKPANHYSGYQRLYRFDASDQSVREISPKIPEATRGALRERHGHNAINNSDADARTKPNQVEEFVVAELSSEQLSTNTIAPDGYVFDNQYRGRRGLFGELFGVGSGRYTLAISKQGRTVGLRTQIQQYYFGNATFLGWVTP